MAGYGTEALEISRCVRGCVPNTLCRLTCAQLLTINHTCKGDGVQTFLMPCSFQEDSFLANFINGAVADYIHSYRLFIHIPNAVKGILCTEAILNDESW